MLSWLVITFLPRSKCILISWLKPPSTVILEHPKIKSATVSTVYSNTTEKIRGTGKKMGSAITVKFKYIIDYWYLFPPANFTADGDCSHEIKIHLLLGRKDMRSLDSI